MRISTFSLLLVSVLVSFAAAGDKCSSSLYQCSNCGGIEVTDCLQCDGFFSTNVKHKICFDRQIFSKHNTDPEDPEDYYDYLWNDILGAAIWFVLSGVAISSGVGGGGFWVPLGILLLRFAPKQSSGLSQASIFGASLGGLILNCRETHPAVATDTPGVRDKFGRILQAEHEGKDGMNIGTENSTCTSKLYTRPLINYDMVLFLAPMEISGAVVGVMIQTLLPNWLYLLLASLVMAFTSYKTYEKGIDVRRVEHQAEQEQKQVAVVEAADVESEVFTEDTEAVKAKDELSTTEPSLDNEGEDGDAALRRKYLEDDMRQYPRKKIISLVILWLVLFMITLFKGGKGVKSLVGITCDSVGYSVLVSLQFVWLFGFAVFFGRKLIAGQTKRVAVRYPYQLYDTVWHAKSLRTFGACTFLSGVVTGMIGISGGMVLGPIMLYLGIHPRVSTSTTATMVVLTSSSVAVISIISGVSPWSYAVFFFSVCLCGALVWKRKIDRYVKRTGRASLLIFILASILLFATISCIGIMFAQLAKKDWCLDEFNKFCTASKGGDECPANRMLNSLLQGTGISSRERFSS